MPQAMLRVITGVAVAGLVAATGCRDRVPSSPDEPGTDAGPRVVSATISNGDADGLVRATIGDAIHLNLSMQDAAGQPVRTRRPFWSSSNPDAASVDSDGTVQAHAAGQADIVASIDSVHPTVHVWVIPQRVRFALRPDSIPLGSDLPIRGVIYDAQGNELIGNTRLEAANADYVALPNPGSVGSFGPVSVFTKAIGSVVVTDLNSALQTTLYITNPVIDTLAPEARSVLVPAGSSRPLSVVALTVSHQFALPVLRKVPVPLTWSSSNPAVVRVDSNGVATGVAEGDATVQATGLGHTAVMSVHVFKYAAPLRFASVAPAVDRTCALDVSGAAYCGGAVNGAGLGGAPLSETLNDSAGTTVSTVPLPVGGGITFAALANGPAVGESCGLGVDGETYCWGNAGAPTRVTGGLRFTTVSIGAHHACGLTSSGSAYCWGFDAQGHALAPQTVANGMTFTSIAAGTSMTCAVTPAAQAYCWAVPEATGSTTFGDPAVVSSPVGFKNVSLGALFACGLGLDNLRYCWGRLDSGPMTASVADPGIALSTLGVGRWYICGMRLGGGALCNASGAGSVTLPVPSDPGLVSLGVGAAVCGFVTDGTLYCWGANDVGQAGVHPVAVKVKGFAMADASYDNGVTAPTKVAGQP